MPQSKLAAVGEGLAETYFPGLLKDRQEAQAKKDREQAMRLAGLQALLKHDDTKEEDVPEILSSIAKELKAEKEFDPILQNMRAGMFRQVPSGDKQETAQSRANRMGANLSAANEQNRPAIDLNVNQPVLHSVPGEPTPTNAPVSPQILKPTPLMVVPPEPDISYQPTRRYGDLTVTEAEDLRRNQSVIATQKAMLDRQADLARIAGDNAAEKEALRQKSQLELEDRRQKGRIDLANKNYENKKSLLEPAALAKVEGDRLAYKHDLILKGVDPAQAEIMAAERAQGLADIVLEQKKQQIAQSKAVIAHWQRQDANQLLAINKRGEGVGGATMGMSAAEARYMNAQLLEVKPALNRAQAELNRLNRVKAATNAGLQPGQSGYDSSFDTQIAAQEKERDDALEKIRSVRQEILDRRPSATTAPAQPGSRTIEGAIQAFKNDPRNPTHRDPTDAEIARMKAALGQ